LARGGGLRSELVGLRLLCLAWELYQELEDDPRDDPFLVTPGGDPNKALRM
jgi:hypothetical protein